MSKVRGVAQVAGLLVATLMVALGAPAQAGSQEAPEVTDAPNDQAILGTVPISTQPPAGTSVGLSVDLIAGWVEEASASTMQFTVQLQGTGDASVNAEQNWRFFFDVGGATYTASASRQAASPVGDGSIAFGGVANGATIGGGLVAMTVAKADIGSPAGGAVFSNLFVEAESRLFAQLDGWITDRAPDDGAGADYTLPGGGDEGGDETDTTTDSNSTTSSESDTGSGSSTDTGTATSSSSASTGASSNTTTNTTAGLDDGAADEKGAPGIGLPLLLAGVAVAAAAFARRGK